jgi:hypothetical protein
MHALIPLSGRSLAIWLAALVSPAAYFLLLLVADRFHIPAPPESVVAGLFFLIPLAALLVSAVVLGKSGMTGGRKLGWMLLSFLVIALQFGGMLVLFIAVQAAIGYAQ